MLRNHWGLIKNSWNSYAVDSRYKQRQRTTSGVSFNRTFLYAGFWKELNFLPLTISGFLISGIHCTDFYRRVKLWHNNWQRESSTYLSDFFHGVGSGQHDDYVLHDVYLVVAPDVEHHPRVHEQEQDVCSRVRDELGHRRRVENHKLPETNHSYS